MIMKTKKILFTAIGHAELVEEELGELLPDEVLIQTDYTVLSAGTEKANLLETPNVKHGFPKLLGYSGSGHVIAVGNQVTDVKPGDRVLTDHLGHCSLVKARFRKNGDGYFPYHHKVDPMDAAFVVIGSMGVQGLRKTHLQMGESVMVTGLGILGMFAIQSAVLSGGLPVIGADFDEKRLEIARTLGADYAINPAEGNFKEKIAELTNGRMLNAQVEVTGSSKALKQCLSVAARMGRITLTGCTRVSDCPIDFYKEVHQPGIQLIGAHNFVRPTGDSREGYWTRHDDFSTILGFLENGKMQVKPIINDVVAPQDCTKVYNRLCTQEEVPLGVVFDWSQLK